MNLWLKYNRKVQFISKQECENQDYNKVHQDIVYYSWLKEPEGTVITTVYSGNPGIQREIQISLYDRDMLGFWASVGYTHKLVDKVEHSMRCAGNPIMDMAYTQHRTPSIHRTRTGPWWPQ